MFHGSAYTMCRMENLRRNCWLALSDNRMGMMSVSPHMNPGVFWRALIDK